MSVPPSSPPLVCAYLLAALIGHALCLEGACLQDGRHKATPTPEPHLQECKMYSENSCCSEEQIRDLVPRPGSRTAPWDQCGTLSPPCESYLKRVACFYRCSPDVARWPRPLQTSLHAVPLCHSFCRDWYEACRMEMTCARNWASDPRGQNCTGSCVPYQQMYQHGRDLCESLWGEAFLTVEEEEEEEEEGGGPPCCLTLSPSDRAVAPFLRPLVEGEGGEEGEELDTTKSGPPPPPPSRAPCSRPPRPTPAPPPAPPVARGNAAPRKRSVLAADDGEGSGSGM